MVIAKHPELNPHEAIVPWQVAKVKHTGIKQDANFIKRCKSQQDGEQPEVLGESQPERRQAGYK